MVAEDTRKYVFLREGGRCEGCRRLFSFKERWQAHHRYFKSQYRGEDRDESWNLSLLCDRCHLDNRKGVHGINKKLDNELKIKADKEKDLYLKKYDSEGTCSIT